MAAYENNIRIEANATYVLAIRWTTEAGIPHELSDARMVVKTQSDGTEVLTASVDNGLITLDPVVNDDGGWARISIPPSSMAALTYYGVGVYDVVLERTSDGVWKRALEGSAVISRGVS